MAESTTTIEDYGRVARVVDHYLEGARSGKSADMKCAFHPDATIFGYVPGDSFAGPIQQLFDWNDDNGPAKDIEAHVASIHVEGTVAAVRVEIDDWTGHRFTDLFTLLKVSGEWKITNKVFHLHERPT